MSTSSHPRVEARNLIGGRRIPIPGDATVSTMPASPSQVVWSGSSPASHVDEAVNAARRAAAPWAKAGIESRRRVLLAFKAIAEARVDELAALIRDETGKPTWDAKAEAQLIAAKVDVTLEEGPNAAMSRVASFEVPLTATRTGRCWFRPHGVMAVVGPFNFPAHLPNGHIVPALAMGNTVVFKPSDKAPACGQLLAEMLHEALDACEAPPGVMNLVQGGADVASSLVSHDGLDGVLFTGSWAVGRRIMLANVDRPGRILALEMGGNSPAAILPDADLDQAVVECVRSAFVTAGQRCTCTRRLVVHRAVADEVMARIDRAVGSLAVGDPRSEPPVFMGPVISGAARSQLLEMHDALAAASGSRVVRPMRALDLPGGGWYVSPGLMEVDRFVRSSPGLPIRAGGDDVEVFGPLLRVVACDSPEEMLEQCNATSYGLAASVFTKSPEWTAMFLDGLRAGCVNLNTGTAGASSRLPFGGLGLSGNHRPAGAFSVDYCAHPIAGMMERGPSATRCPGMG
ncbi:MAG: aldehyde dehydrogenase family protein [Phycisphaerae bacterium]|jgi:succinylglutamic semialdehyde dehydrogenase